MSVNGKVVKPVTGNSSLVRPRFSTGMVLRDDDLKQGIDYTRDLSRLLFRTLFGCGVVCGLKVSQDFKCNKLILTVADGVALNCYGDPVHVPEPQQIPIDPSCGEEIPQKMWVVLRQTEKCCAPRAAACSCDDEETPAVCTRERDCFEIRILQEPPDCRCGCPTQTPTGRSSTTTTRAVNTIKKKEIPSSGAIRVQKSDNDSLVGNAEAGGQGKGSTDCWCADPENKCYREHYQGLCGCECCCDCEWIVLAYVVNDPNSKDPWQVDHTVRRFVRPVLMRDPVAWDEAHPGST